MNTIIINELEELKYGRREAINSLRTNLKFAGTDVKVVVFTSCFPNEGKSTVTFDLAKAFADAGSKTLLIDADMRKTVMLQRHRIKNQGQKISGLTHYLSGQAEMESIFNATNVENLYIALAGPLSPNPAELLTGDPIDELIEYCRKNYDIVIIDTPPLGSVIDAAIIAPKCDGVVLVTEANATSARMAISVKKQLEMTDCKILGCVLNKVPSTGNQYKYRYKYYGEYKADKEDKKEKAEDLGAKLASRSLGRANRNKRRR